MTARVALPDSLKGTFFDGRWDREEVWALPTPQELAPFAELAWHLELTVWSTDPPRPLFDLAPHAVLEAPTAHPRHWERIVAAVLGWPLELFRNGGRWVVLDGYHRLARHALLGSAEVSVRRHADNLLGVIRAAPADGAD